MRVQFGPLLLDIRPGWADVTADLGSEDNPPWTLARQSDTACGALQFSVALYRRGPVPDPTPGFLAELLRDFAAKSGLGPASDEVVESVPIRLAGATFRDEECMIRGWYVSDGRSFAKITYTVGIGNDFASELSDCEQMVRSIRFADPGGAA
jgi:hypothetical protein